MSALDGIILGITAGVAALLVYAAYSDIRTRRIPNWLNGALAILGLTFVAANVANGTVPTWGLYHGLAALCVFAAGIGLFALGLMGGGDVKMMGAFALIAGPNLALPFVLITTVMGGLVAFATLSIAKLRLTEGSGPETEATLTVPYGVAISIAGLWVLGKVLAPLFA